MSSFFHYPAPKSWPETRSEIRFKPLLPFHYVEWLGHTCAYRLSRWSFLAILEYLGTLSLLIAVIAYFAESGDRVQQRHYQAWQVINTAQGKGGAGGRIDALQNLNEDHVPLVGVDLSSAFLQGLNLPHADLRRCTILGADLLGAKLPHADLSDSSLTNSNFRQADLRYVNFTAASLKETDLTEADLSNADVSGASFENADLSGADLSGLKNWNKIAKLHGTILADIKHAPDGFLKWAQSKGATIVESSTVP